MTHAEKSKNSKGKAYVQSILSLVCLFYVRVSYYTIKKGRSSFHQRPCHSSPWPSSVFGHDELDMSWLPEAAANQSGGRDPREGPAGRSCWAASPARCCARPAGLSCPAPSGPRSSTAARPCCPQSRRFKHVWRVYGPVPCHLACDVAHVRNTRAGQATAVRQQRALCAQ